MTIEEAIQTQENMMKFWASWPDQKMDLQDAIDILEKAKPTKILRFHKWDMEISGYCPWCGTEIGADVTYFPKYCEECGQHLIWEEEQEDDEYFL